jgi:hypothetical protein
MNPQVASGWLVLSLLVAAFGMNRKFGFWGYLFASLMLSPAIGLLLVLASGKRPAKAKAAS